MEEEIFNYEIRVGNNRYILGKRLGFGAFGEIYWGTTMTGEHIAVKMEPVTAKHPQLKFESKLLTMLGDEDGFTKLEWFGIEGEFNVMVFQLCGPNLEDVRTLCGGHLSLKTVLMLADQMIHRLDHLHSKHYIHRDIKPENFCMGKGVQSNKVFLIDFGLAKRYRDKKTHQHITYKENRHLTGTARYASINAHLGIEQSRRDDLEALGYLLLYLLAGKLPWQGQKGRIQNKEEKYERILAKKLSTPVECIIKDPPLELCTYLQYAKNLKFEEKPDYTFLRRMVQDLIFLHDDYDCIYDWTTFVPQKAFAPEAASSSNSHVHVMNAFKKKNKSEFVTPNPKKSRFAIDKISVKSADESESNLNSDRDNDSSLSKTTQQNIENVDLNEDGDFNPFHSMNNKNTLTYLAQIEYAQMASMAAKENVEIKDTNHRKSFTAIGGLAPKAKKNNGFSKRSKGKESSEGSKGGETNPLVRKMTLLDKFREQNKETKTEKLQKDKVDGARVVRKSFNKAPTPKNDPSSTTRRKSTKAGKNKDNKKNYREPQTLSQANIEADAQVESTKANCDAIIEEAKAEKTIAQSIQAKRNYQYEMAKAEVLEKLAQSGKVVIAGKTGETLFESIVTALKKEA